MQRNELSITDDNIIKIIEKIWGFSSKSIDYIDLGGTFTFKLVNTLGDKTFLKIYSKSMPSDPVENVTPVSLEKTCIILERLRTKHAFQQVPKVIKTKYESHFHEEKDLIFILFSYLEGQHPNSRYAISGFNSKQLAAIFKQLHTIPISAYPELKRETFNIDYALGIEPWLNINNSMNINYLINNPIQERNRDILKNNSMLEKISESRVGLYKCLQVLKQYQEKFVTFLANAEINVSTNTNTNMNANVLTNLSSLDLVLTHGDAHHCNILQNEKEVFLIDWDNIKIGPRERDLWFYEFAPLINDYLQINLDFQINHDLCLYYQTQRFLEDLRIFLEQETDTTKQTTEQAYDNREDFLNHWGWIECYERIKNL